MKSDGFVRLESLGLEITGEIKLNEPRKQKWSSECRSP